MKLAAALVFVTLLAIGIMSIKPEALTKKQCQDNYWKTEEKILEQGTFRETQCKLAGDDEACYQQLLVWALKEGEFAQTTLNKCLKAAKQ